jgi:hypothetical protein
MAIGQTANSTIGAATGVLSGIATWQFLGEPAWRWGIFTGMVIAFMIAWSGVLRHM